MHVVPFAKHAHMHKKRIYQDFSMQLQWTATEAVKLQKRYKMIPQKSIIKVEHVTFMFYSKSGPNGKQLTGREAYQWWTMQNLVCNRPGM